MGLFGGEKITLMLEKYDYKPGDVIKGTVNLKLKKPTNARKLEVGLIGMRVQSQVSRVTFGGSGHHPPQHQQPPSHMIIYDFWIPLDVEKEYQGGTYTFEIKIPSNILQGDSQMEGKLGATVNILKSISGTSSRVEWYVEAKLDVPMMLDVRKKQEIVLSP